MDWPGRINMTGTRASSAAFCCAVPRATVRKCARARTTPLHPAHVLDRQPGRCRRAGRDRRHSSGAVEAGAPGGSALARRRGGAARGQRGRRRPAPPAARSREQDAGAVRAHGRAAGALPRRVSRDLLRLHDGRAQRRDLLRRRHGGGAGQAEIAAQAGALRVHGAVQAARRRSPIPTGCSGSPRARPMSIPRSSATSTGRSSRGTRRSTTARAATAASSASTSICSTTSRRKRASAPFRSAR